MSSQGFSFPPPPPPPPRQQPQQQQYNHATYPPPYGQSYNGQRGGRGGGRGRGRGYGNRGGGRGGHFAASPQAYTSNTAAPSVGYAPVNYGFAAQAYPPTPTPGIPTPQFAAASQQPSSFQHTAFPSPQPFSQPTSYNGIYNPSTAPTTPAYPSTMPPYQHASPSTQPSMMGPPMHWGFEQPGQTGAFPTAQHGNNWGPRPFNHNSYGNNPPMGDKPMKHLNKRDHASAFSKPRIPAPPAVPSFGNPLPTKPPPPSDATRKPKKKRKHNQLGLTPKTEEHESSEEDDDMDEESKLTSGGTGAATAALRFTYKGRTATLQTPEEIAAWIAERKKRFPTRAKAEEKKKAIEEAKKAREEALKQKREARNQDTKRPQKGGRGQEQQRDASGNPVDAAAKATQKADKLRRKLLREQKRVAKAEADAEQARLKVEELQKGSTASTGPATEPQETTQSPATAAEPVSGEGHEPLKPATTPLTETQLDDAEISSSFDTSDGSDWTSSSGSEDTSSGSEESDDDDDDGNDSDSAPEEMSSRREGPERVPPPPRDNIKKRVCRHFARNGRCLRGDKCNFLHETPERKTKAKPMPQKGRKGLLQMVSLSYLSTPYAV